MDHLAGKQSIAVFRTSSGFEGRATVLRLAAFAVGIEIYHPGLVVQTSELLHNFQITLQDQVVYSGRAVVSQVISTGPTLVCEVTLENGRLEPNFFAAIRKVEHLRERFQRFMATWQENYKILPRYKTAVVDLQSYLAGLRQWMEHVELGIRSTPTADRPQLEQSSLEELGRVVVPVINHFFEEFETITAEIPPDKLTAHRAFLQSQLHPLVLCSPFAYRTYAKPLGYAGDYEMVNMMTRNPFEGGSVFAKILNLWFLRQAPAEAHRNRVEYLQRVLLQEASRVSPTGRPLRVFNLACGPAVEVQRFLADTLASDRVRFDLLDFNDETLAHTRKVLGVIKQLHGRSTALSFIQKTVHQLIKQSMTTVERPPDQQYDLIYCAGLFDYLTDAVCQRLTTLLYGWLAPKGLLLVTNVDPSNPLRYGMEHLLDWHLVYRSAARLRTLAPTQVPAEDAVVKSEFTGVNLFLEARKHGHV